VVVVGDVVKVHEAAHDVILEARLLDASAPEGDDLKFVSRTLLSILGA
jgi:hypothetical protein